MRTPIHVTRPALPPLEEFVGYLEGIWESGVMTHNGPLVQQLERELCAYLDVPHLVCVASGTCALQLALRALELEGEVITSPFTFIATANIIDWERCRPVFAEIDPQTWNLDPARIEERISPRTSAILPVHVFSAPCEMDAIEEIAARHGLRVICDGAHALGVECEGRSLLRRGDISAVSFHATKLFNTGEGGACITEDADLAARLRRLRFFGFDERKEIVDAGMNAKMTEIAAALGLANLRHLDAVRRRRRRRAELYRALLGELPFVRLQRVDGGMSNDSYMPVVFESEELLERVQAALRGAGIHPRRYFHPALNTLARFAPQPELEVAERIAGTVLCLPLYDTLEETEIERICRLIGQVAELALS